MDDLRWPAKIFFIVLVLTAGVVGGTLLVVSGLPDRQQLGLVVVLIALTALAKWFPVHGGSHTKFSLHTSVVFAAILLVDPAAALLIASLGTLIAQVLRRQPWDETLFNTAQMILQAALSGLVLVFGGWDFASLRLNQPAMLGLLGGASLVMYVVEVTSVAAISALQSGESISSKWRQIASFDPVELMAQFALGLLGAIVLDDYLWLLPLLLPPTLVIYRSSARQVALQQHAQQLAHDASHDALTRLPNRALFLDRLQHALDRATRRDPLIAVLFLDLDRFKVINDSLGHDVGDQLLVAVAERLRIVLRPEDTIARFGGDEFTLLLEDIVAVSDVIHIVDRVVEVLQQPFHLSGYEVVVSTSIGIALSNGPNRNPQALLQAADVAMYRAKDKGKARYELFDAEMNAQAQERLQQETELRYAGERQELRVYYQPIVDMHSGRIVYFEALVRWEHPQHGLIGPASFIPLAEETGLIVGIGRWVLETACRQMQQWQVQYPEIPPIHLSVNISVHELKYGKLTEEIACVLARTGLEARLLQVEITESAMLEDVEEVHGILQTLKDSGIQVAIDDFGTGYSSLRYLQHFPVEILKIDKDFVEELRQDAGNIGVVEAISKLAATLKMEVVAEGIETVEQFIQLRSLDCSLGQGYYFSRPLPVEAIDRLLAEGAHFDVPHRHRMVVS